MKHSVFVGSYAPAEAKGIHVLSFDDTTGALVETGGVSGVVNPSYLAVNRGADYLYAVSEGGGGGEAFALALDSKTGLPTVLNRQSARGGGPCHVSLDKGGKAVLVANYNTGSIAVLPLGKGGKLAAASASVQHLGSGKDPKRQSGPHAHCIQTDPTGKFVLACDLGLDKVLIYRYDSGRRTLLPGDPAFFATAPGAGPRHFAWHPGGNLVFIINELNSTLTSCRWDSRRGALTEVQTFSTLPSGYTGNNSTAAVRVHPNGRFVYGSNRGHDSIAVFRVDDKTGKLEGVGFVGAGGKTPRDFNVDPSGRFLLVAHQDSDTVAVFRINEGTGVPAATSTVISVSKPVCVVFAP